jgi:uncharacterized membrane protein
MNSPTPVASVPPYRPKIPDDAYRRMTLVLRVGLVTSLAILLAGLIAYLVTQPGATSGSALAGNPILQYLSLGGLVHGIASGSLEAFLTLGLLVLVATPIVRVASGFYYFRRGHETSMAAVTITVLALLLVGLLLIGPFIR